MTKTLIPPVMPVEAPRSTDDDDDDFVHIVWDNAPNKALCGREVTDYELVPGHEGPECPACAKEADFWKSLEPDG